MAWGGGCGVIKKRSSAMAINQQWSVTSRTLRRNGGRNDEIKLSVWHYQLWWVLVWRKIINAETMVNELRSGANGWGRRKEEGASRKWAGIDERSAWTGTRKGCCVDEEKLIGGPQWSIDGTRNDYKWALIIHSKRTLTREYHLRVNLFASRRFIPRVGSWTHVGSSAS